MTDLGLLFQGVLAGLATGGVIRLIRYSLPAKAR